jgi:accessory gene regulator protein AgrB
MSKVDMRGSIYAGLLISSIFVYMLTYIEELTFSNFFGWLAFSIATGAIAFFAIFAPYGFRSHTTVFGRRQKYKQPVPEIPGKIAGQILIVVVVCCAISFGFNIYGM